MSAKRLRTSMVMVSAGAALLAALVAGACTTATSQDKADLAARGDKAFRDQGCYGCHLVGKFGTPIGPDLSKVGAKYDEAYIARWLRDPSAQRPAHMPTLALTPAEVEALTAFLATQR